MKAREDKNGNMISETNIAYEVLDFTAYNVASSVSNSETTESVYVRYQNNDNGMSVTVRFSNHTCNAVLFGDKLDGNTSTRDEILFHLGLKTRTFVQRTYLFIGSRQVGKKDLNKYEESDLTIKEMYALGANADLSVHNGKLAKGSNYLVLDNKVSMVGETGFDAFGNKVKIGNFIYN